MSQDDAYDAFYEARRTERLPLAVNDVVTVGAGGRRGARAWVISLQSLRPDPTYLVEFEDGSSEVVPVSSLHREETPP